jgi:hypothetical protein
MLASGRLSASTVPVYCRSINRPESHRQPCPAAPPVLVSPSPAPIPRRKATGRRLDPTSSNLTPRPNPHRARGTDAAPTFRDFVPWRFSDAGRPSRWRLCHRRRPKTCTIAVTGGVYLQVATKPVCPFIFICHASPPPPSFSPSHPLFRRATIRTVKMFLSTWRRSAHILLSRRPGHVT